jgi:hypothetical protein
VVVIVSPRFPCILFDLNLVTATYISTFLEHKDRHLAPKEKLECIPLNASLFTTTVCLSPRHGASGLQYRG